MEETNTLEDYVNSYESYNLLGKTLTIPLELKRQILRNEIVDKIKKLREDARRKGTISAAQQATPKEEDLEIRLGIEQRLLEAERERNRYLIQENEKLKNTPQPQNNNNADSSFNQCNEEKKVLVKQLEICQTQANETKAKANELEAEKRRCQQENYTTFDKVTLCEREREQEKVMANSTKSQINEEKAKLEENLAICQTKLNNVTQELKETRDNATNLERAFEDEKRKQNLETDNAISKCTKNLTVCYVYLNASESHLEFNKNSLTKCEEDRKQFQNTINNFKDIERNITDTYNDLKNKFDLVKAKFNDNLTECQKTNEQKVTDITDILKIEKGQAAENISLCERQKEEKERISNQKILSLENELQTNKEKLKATEAEKLKVEQAKAEIETNLSKCLSDNINTKRDAKAEREDSNLQCGLDKKNLTKTIEELSKRFTNWESDKKKENEVADTKMKELENTSTLCKDNVASLQGQINDCRTKYEIGGNRCANCCNSTVVGPAITTP